MTTILKAVFHGEDEEVVYTRKAYQHDREVILRVSGIALPEEYQAHFSNDEHEGVGIAKSVSGSDILIPNAFFQTGKYVYVWLYFGEGISTLMVVIPVEPRPAYVDSSDMSGDIIATLGEDEEEHTLIFTRI